MKCLNILINNYIFKTIEPHTQEIMFLKLRHKIDRYVDIVNFTGKKHDRVHSKLNELELENMKKENSYDVYILCPQKHFQIIFLI